MLVCNVSLRPKRSATSLSVDMIEAAAALDDVATENMVFATLVDDPGSASETLDAYLGTLMVEAAGAADIADATIQALYAVDIVEAATAAETADGTVVVVSATAIWDAATALNVTLSGGNLIVTNTASGDCGAKVASGKTTGKYYYEETITTRTGGGNNLVGIGTPASTYADMGDHAGAGVVWYPSGNVWANGSVVTFVGVWNQGDVLGVAVDLDNRKIWFRKAPSGSWNGVGGYDPATNTGGFTISAGTMVPFAVTGGSGSAAGNVYTANFGASAFVGAVPSGGFTAGWPT